MNAIEMLKKSVNVTYFYLTDEEYDRQEMVKRSPVGDDGFRRGSDLLFWHEGYIDENGYDSDAYRAGKFGISELIERVARRKEGSYDIGSSQEVLLDDIVAGVSLLRSGAAETYSFRDTVSKQIVHNADARDYPKVRHDYLTYDAIEDVVSGDWWVEMVWIAFAHGLVKINLTGEDARLFHEEFARVLKDSKDQDFNIDNGDVHPIMAFMNTQMYQNARKVAVGHDIRL